MGWSAPAFPRTSARLTKVVTALGVLLVFYAGSYAGWRPLPAQETSGVKVSLQVIVVDTASKAQEALERLKRGAKFADVAKELSIDPNAISGGYVGEADA